jgi:hypothetical protein
MLTLVRDLINLRLGLDLGRYLGKKTFTIWSIYVKLLVSPAPMSSSCVVPIKMKVNCLCLISNSLQKLSRKTPGYAPLALSRGFRLTNIVTIFINMAKNAQIMSYVNHSRTCGKFYEDLHSVGCELDGSF